MRATKSVSQEFQIARLEALLHECVVLTYNAMRYADLNGISSRKAMNGFYQSLKDVQLPSCYKIAAITRACAIIKSRKKSQKRGVTTLHPKPIRPVICITSGFFITSKGRLFVPLQRRNDYADVILNRYVRQKIQGKKIRSLAILPNSLSLCYSMEIEANGIRTIYGVDRNEMNITFGNAERIVQITLSRTVRIRQTTREIVASFKRADDRVRRRLASKYWRRAKSRTDQILHAGTNFAINAAAIEGAAIALEDLRGIKKMYQKGRLGGADYRFRLNSWPQWKTYQMLEYKSAWKGVTFIPLTKAETYGTSSTHVCGERLRSPARDDVVHQRMLWCQACKAWTDRDVNAAVVLSQRGLARFASSHPWLKGHSQQLEAGEEGLAGEAMKGNGTATLILRVDASKLGQSSVLGTGWHILKA